MSQDQVLFLLSRDELKHLIVIADVYHHVVLGKFPLRGITNVVVERLTHGSWSIAVRNGTRNLAEIGETVETAIFKLGRAVEEAAKAERESWLSRIAEAESLIEEAQVRLGPINDWLSSLREVLDSEE